MRHENMYQLPGLPEGFIYPDINAGLDYEREVSRLQAVAGTAFRAYWKAKHDPRASKEAVDELRDTYVRAHDAVRQLKPIDLR